MVTKYKAIDSIEVLDKHDDDILVDVIGKGKIFCVECFNFNDVDIYFSKGIDVYSGRITYNQLKYAAEKLED